MKPFHLCVLSIILTTIVNQAFSVDSSYYDACKPQTCGNGPNISYPFWLSDQQESYCGYPSFKLACNDQNLVLTISDDDYIIKDIFYSNHSFLVANSVAFKEDECPLPIQNLSLDRTPFSYSSTHVDFSFFYNCSQEPVDDMHTYAISCSSNSTFHSFATFHKEVVEYMNHTLLDSCKSTVDVPVDDHEATGVDTLLEMSYTEILKTGFLLNWTAQNCSNCVTSGGLCGFNDNEFVCFCSDRTHDKTCDDENKFNWRIKVVVGATAAGTVMLLLSVIVVIVRCVKSRISKRKSNQSLEAFIQNNGPLGVKRYKFSDIRKMTNSFKDKLGKGGYGDVYKGQLLDVCPVAVKVLNASKGNGDDFVNEVASISRTSHVNVVRLLGYCFQGDKRALIYEFMSNGSLEKFIYKDSDPLKATPHLKLGNLFQIATGIARGLEYLHRGCNTRILHFDIKPHNILLDETFCPKISDFGLSRLCTKESIISMLDARGTIGYIAPEVFCRNFGGVSVKSDVYSYGMMILEMVGGRKNVDARVSHTSEIYFPDSVYEHLEQGSNFGLLNAMTEEEKEIARKMILVGLWCIQTKPTDRPSMSKVIEMLEGSIEALQIPPKPILSSPVMSAPPESTTLSTLS